MCIFQINIAFVHHQILWAVIHVFRSVVEVCGGSAWYPPLFPSRLDAIVVSNEMEMELRTLTEQHREVRAVWPAHKDESIRVMHKPTMNYSTFAIHWTRLFPQLIELTVTCTTESKGHQEHISMDFHWTDCNLVVHRLHISTPPIWLYIHTSKSTELLELFLNLGNPPNLLSTHCSCTQ